MARHYTDEDKAAVFVALTVNNDNIKRTHRDTQIPESTIRDWRREWELAGGPPPEIYNLTEQMASGFVEEAEEVRDLALNKLKESIKRGTLKEEKLITVVGVLEDKIRLGKGLVTSRSETVASTPDAKELGKELGAYLIETLRKDEERDDEINKAGVQEIIPQKELSVTS